MSCFLYNLIYVSSAEQSDFVLVKRSPDDNLTSTASPEEDIDIFELDDLEVIFLYLILEH